MDRKLAQLVGEAARAARGRARLTQADVAERLGITVEVYGRMERGTVLPSVPTLRHLCEVLAVSADELLGLREGARPPRISEEGASYGDRPEMRRLARRARRLDRRSVRLLAILAAELAR